MLALIKKLSIILAFILFSARCFAQQQGLDPSFGNGGIAPAYTTGGRWASTALQPDGKILVVGIDTASKIARFNSNGTHDNTFGMGGAIVFPQNLDFVPSKVIILPDSSTLISGTSGYWITTPSTYYNADFSCVKFRKTGVIDSSFGNNGVVTTDLTNPVFAYLEKNYNTGVAIQPDGKIILCGYDGEDTIEMTRYYPQGTVDSSFGVNGIVKTYGGDYSVFCNAIAIQTDGKILLGGTFSSGGLGAALILRYNTDGSPDTSFNHTGRLEWFMGGNEVSDLKLQPDGKILVATGISYDPQMPTGAEVILRLLPDGSLDTSFNHTGYLPIVRLDYWPVQGGNGGCHIALLSNGDIVMGGTLGDTVQYSNNKYASLSRCTKDGIPDSSFGINGKTVLTIGQYGSTWLHDIAVQPDGKIITAGSNGDFGTSSGGSVLARFMPNGSAAIHEVPNQKNSLIVYPNPCHETLYISGYDEKTAGKIQQIQIINSLGQVIYNRSAPCALGPINCAPLPNGVYFLIVRGPHYSVTSKFLKE